MSLNTCSAVSRMILSMMGILVGSWDDGVDKSVTIHTSVSSDGDWELTSYILGWIASKNGGSTSMTIWSSTEGSEGY